MSSTVCVRGRTSKVVIYSNLSQEEGKNTERSPAMNGSTVSSCQQIFITKGDKNIIYTTLTPSMCKHVARVKSSKV